MWGSGAARRRQQLAAKQMVAAAEATGDYTAPWRSDPSVWEHFSTEADILVHLQKSWRNALAGAIYVAMEQGGPSGSDLTTTVDTVFETIARRHRGVRAVLEAHREHPAIRAAMAKEETLLASLRAGTQVTPGRHVARLVAAA